MTVEELRNIPYLANEIKRFDKLISDLDRNAENDKKAIPIQMKSEFDEAIEEYRNVLIDCRERCRHELKTLTAFIEGIEDQYIKSIFKARFVDQKSWCRVAYNMGGYNSEDTVKMTCHRYLEKYNARAENRPQSENTL